MPTKWKNGKFDIASERQTQAAPTCNMAQGHFVHARQPYEQMNPKKKSHQP
jgi:hypothetical protein